MLNELTSMERIVLKAAVETVFWSLLNDNNVPEHVGRVLGMAHLLQMTHPNIADQLSSLHYASFCLGLAKNTVFAQGSWLQ
jgi:hypothetical protein